MGGLAVKVDAVTPFPENEQPPMGGMKFGLRLRNQ